MSSTERGSGLSPIVLYDHHPLADRFCEDVIRGLAARPKRLQPMYFYDERGARLFEEICELPEYYLTRTERSILRGNIGAIAGAVGPRARVLEFGSGSGEKTLLLLEHLEDAAAYIPVDISRGQLVEYAISVAESFPCVDVLPVCADFTSGYDLPETGREFSRTVAFFPGSTIGNFERTEALAFLRHVAWLCGPGGGLLIGVDLKKDAEVIERAYNDRHGVTAAFNLNLLARINRECGGDLDISGFAHEAPYDSTEGRVEMRLVSRRRQKATIGTGSVEGTIGVRFEAGEHILTEYSHKYAPSEFESLAARAGWKPDGFWTDEREWFGIWLMRRDA